MSKMNIISYRYDDDGKHVAINLTNRGQFICLLTSIPRYIVTILPCESYLRDANVFLE